VTADQTDGSEGRLTVELAAKTSNPFAPVPVANSVLVLSWFDLGNERFEVVAYLS
jgi:hypothetical protein